MVCLNAIFRLVAVVVQLSALASATEGVFEFEQTQLTDAQAAENPLYAFGDLTNGKPNSARCKTFPGDDNWPSAETWQALNASLGGALIATVPIAAACHTSSGHFDASQCKYLMDNWSHSNLHAADPSSIMTPWLAGRTCDPTSDSASPCSLGGYPSYVVNASTVLDMQLAINFARNTNVRLVIKNTGHDFSGKSAGAGALSIWTHNIKHIQFVESYAAANYTGPAVQLSLGVQTFEAYAAAKREGVTVIGGEGESVGIAGGFALGGGHSPLSGVYGMGADQVLSMNVIQSDGRFVTASATETSDLFWALRGGGGGTFGLVTAITFKTYPRLPTTVVKLSFSTSDTVTHETFWQGARAYFDTIIPSVDAGMYSYFSILPDASGGQTFTLQPFLAPDKTVEETNALLEPFYSRLAELGIPIDPAASSHDNYPDAWSAGFNADPVAFSGQIGSRLFPRRNFVDESTLDRTFDAIKNNSDAGNIFLGFSLAPTLERGGWEDTAVNPHWRDTVLHAWAGAMWPQNATDEDIAQVQETFSGVTLQQWRDVAPNSGCYLNEAYSSEPNWQEEFYGSVYASLYRIKQTYDPFSLFYAVTGVGSEQWKVETVNGLPGTNGKLCRAD